MSRRLAAIPTRREDLGTPEARRHGDWHLIDLPVVGRRIQRDPIHTRLLMDEKITPAQWQAAEAFVDDYALADGVREGDRLSVRVDGSGGFEPTDTMLDAVTRLGRAHRVLGALAPVMEAACLHCVSLRELARLMFGDDGGAARERAEAAVIVGLARLGG